MLAFTADSTYRNEMVYGRSDIWTVTADGALKKLTSNTDYSYAGAQYLARRHVDSHDALDADRRGDREEDGQRRPGRRRAAFRRVADARSISPRTWDYLPSAPFWSRDGKYVYFTGGIGGTTHLFRVRGERRHGRAGDDGPAPPERVQLRSRADEDGVRGRHVRGAVGDLRRATSTGAARGSSRTCTTRSRTRSR